MGCGQYAAKCRATHPSLVVDARAVLGDALAVRLHVTLLEIVGKLVEILVIREERLGLGAIEVVVPDAEKSQDHGQVLLELGLGKVLVHGVGAGKEVLEVVKPDADRDGKADSRPERVAAANPVPELEHVGLGNAELGDALGVGREGDEVLSNVRLLGGVSVMEQRGALTSLAVWRNHSLAVSALVIVSWVVNVLEATMKSVVSGSQARRTSAMSVPSMLETKWRLRLRWL